MARHLDERLEDYLWGTLSVAERDDAEAHLRECEACRQLSERLERSMASLTPSLPAPALGLARLEQAVTGGRRFAHLVPALAELFDLPPAAVETLLERVDERQGWVEGAAPGVRILPVSAGPARAGFLTGFVWLEPGATYPEHGHGAEERTLVLEGGYRCTSGVEVWRGELDVRPPGSPPHAFSALAGAPCLCAGVTRPPEP